MFALTLWSLGYALELASANLTAKLLWTKVEYIGILIVPTAFLSFTLQHTHREKWLTRHNVRVLVLIPLITLLVVWTNDYHHLFHHRTVRHPSCLRPSWSNRPVFRTIRSKKHLTIC